MEVCGRNGGLEAAQFHARLKCAWTCTGKVVPLVGDAVDDLLAGEKAMSPAKHDSGQSEVAVSRHSGWFQANIMDISKEMKKKECGDFFLREKLLAFVKRGKHNNNNILIA